MTFLPATRTFGCDVRLAGLLVGKTKIHRSTYKYSLFWGGREGEGGNPRSLSVLCLTEDFRFNGTERKDFVNKAVN